MAADNRKDPRIDIHEDIMFSHRVIHPFCYYGGKALNHSPGGICLQSHYGVHPGDSLCLRLIGNHLQAFTSLDELTCIAEVRWCETIGTPERPSYRIGLHYHGDLVPPLFRPLE